MYKPPLDIFTTYRVHAPHDPLPQETPEEIYSPRTEAAHREKAWDSKETSRLNRLKPPILKIHEAPEHTQSFRDCLSIMELQVLTHASECWNRVMGQLEKSLEDIESSILFEYDATSTRLGHGRYMLGIWRSLIPQMIEERNQSIQGMKARYEIETQPNIDLELSDYGTSLPVIVQEYTQLVDACKAGKERAERAAQGLMSTLSIMESQSAIRQGHEIQKLTELAFVFIPLSFVTSFFGMEIKVCANIIRLPFVIDSA